MSQIGQLIPVAPGAGFIATLTGDIGGPVSPVLGNINILGGVGITVTGTPGTLTIDLDAGGVVTSITGTANQIDVSASSGAVTLSIPVVFIAPGSIAATTTVTAATDFISTAGNLLLPTSTATQGQIQINASRVFHSFGTNNLFVGDGGGNFTLSGSRNTTLGNQGVLSNLTSGSDNTIIGAGAGVAMQDTFANVVLGRDGLLNLVSGTDNVAIGTAGNVPPNGVGQSYTTNESSNILINHAGVIGESNTMRLGTLGNSNGQINRAFIAAIYQAAIGATNEVVLVDSAGQLGSSKGTDGQVLIGSTALSPAWSTITAGAGITVTNASNSITIASTATAFAWTEVVGTAVALAVNNGYIMNNGALVTGTLPAAAAVGQIISIVGKGTGGWLIAQNAGQTIHFVSGNTTTGVAGSLASTVRYDCIELICTTANTDFVVRSSMGNITIV